MILYHGTTARRLAPILDRGLLPRETLHGKGRSGHGNWKGTVPSNKRAVYLTNCYALHFATAALQDGDAALIIELDTDLLDPSRLAPDEDAVEQANRGKDSVPGDMKARTLFYRRRIEQQVNAGQIREMWAGSLAALGTCCYLAPIPRAAMLRYAIIPAPTIPALIMGAFDPIICLENHRIMGGRHQAFHEWIFEGGSRTVTDVFPIPFVLPAAWHEGIEVRACTRP